MPLSDQAADDEAWLRDRLGRRYLGCSRLADGTWEARAQKGTGRMVWCFGRTPDDALAKLRAKVEGK